MLRSSFRIPTVRTLTALVAFILPLGLSTVSQAQSAGGALANGNVWSLGRAMSIQANQSKYGSTYSGYVTMMGKYNGVRFNYPSIYVASPVWTKMPDGVTSVCTAYGDATFSSQSAQVAFTWSQNASDGSKNGIAWKFVAYKTTDQPGKPTGAVLNSSPALAPVDGRVLVNLPGTTSTQSPDDTFGEDTWGSGDGGADDE